MKTNHLKMKVGKIRLRYSKDAEVDFRTDKLFQLMSKLGVLVFDVPFANYGWRNIGARHCSIDVSIVLT